MYDDFKTANYPQAVVSPELYARHLSRLYSGDVIDGLIVTPGTGLQVVLGTGNTLIRYGSAAVASARLVSLVASFNLTIATADVSNPRIDLVVLYIDNGVTLPGGTPTAANLDGKGVAKAKIVQGTPASSPSDPNATAIQASVGSGNPYSVVARVRVNSGVSVIAANQIADLRPIARVEATRIDANTFTYVRATKGSTQALNTGSTAVVAFPTEISDALNEYDPSSGVFTATQSGLYYVSASMRWTQTFTGTNVVSIQVNGANRKEANWNNIYNYETNELSGVISVVAGDVIRVLWSNQTGSTRTIDSNATSQQLMIARVS